MTESMEVMVYAGESEYPEKLEQDAVQGRKVPLWMLELLMEQYENMFEEQCPEWFAAVEDLILIVEAVTQVRTLGAMETVTAACIGQELFDLLAMVKRQEPVI
ncbi:MAG: hypothetical protein HPY85_06780 [Anaerolineae bacterium]|nr:hypothetical protein [Anaerolineae bacterium]